MVDMDRNLETSLSRDEPRRPKKKDERGSGLKLAGKALQERDRKPHEDPALVERGVVGNPTD